MRRKLRFTNTSDEQLTKIESTPTLRGVLKQVRKTLGYLETNLRAKSLQTHKHKSLTKRYNREVFEVYVQQDTPGAYRIYWHYGPDETGKDGKPVPVITILLITPHP